MVVAMLCINISVHVEGHYMQYLWACKNAYTCIGKIKRIQKITKILPICLITSAYQKWYLQSHLRQIPLEDSVGYTLHLKPESPGGPGSPRACPVRQNLLQKSIFCVNVSLLVTQTPIQRRPGSTYLPQQTISKQRDLQMAGSTPFSPAGTGNSP